MVVEPHALLCTFHTHTHTHTHTQAGHVCGDSMDIVNGEPTGSVRVSFGYMSTLKDAQTLIHFIESCFVDHGPSSEVQNLMRKLVILWVFLAIYQTQWKIV